MKWDKEVAVSQLEKLFCAAFSINLVFFRNNIKFFLKNLIISCGLAQVFCRHALKEIQLLIDINY